jgi:hypothetical protein
MSAIETFQHFNDSLPKEARTSQADLLKQTLDDLFAARSEDARLRLVGVYTREMNLRLGRTEKNPRNA